MSAFEARSKHNDMFAFDDLDDCFESGKVIFASDYSSFNDVCIPERISRSVRNTCGGSGASGVNAAALARTVVYGTLAAGVATGIIAFFAMGAEYTVMVDVCTNMFVVQPYEFLNLRKYSPLKLDHNLCVPSDNTNLSLTSIDVPFYYHCDPYYDPKKPDVRLSDKEPKDQAFIGKTWGYMKTTSPYCINPALDESDKEMMKGMIGKVVVHTVNGFFRIMAGLNSACNKAGEGDPERMETIFEAGDYKEIWSYTMFPIPVTFLAYYKYNIDISKIQICVAAPYLLMPIKVGCSYVPPPYDDSDLDAFVKSYLEDTRCYYFLTDRTDLASLGNNLPDPDSNGNPKSYVKDFLKSNMHVISTTVGCIEDLLAKVFMNSIVSDSSGTIPFFSKIQNGFKAIVYASLVIYLIMIGFDIIVAIDIPRNSEILMHILKFGLVIYFATGNVWYSIDENNQKTGLYPSLMGATNQIAGLFMSSQNDNDPIGFCKYRLWGTEIFQDRKIPTSNPLGSGGDGKLVETIGFPGYIKMTVWDLVNCKFVNYLNFGACKYSISGMMGVWLIGASFFASASGFLLSLVSFVYCFLLLIVILKFLHITILSMFALTVLILLAPLMVCFTLFKYTSDICEKWMMMILGYILYPGFLFAFIALMFATLDSVYYGDIQLNGKSNPTSADVITACLYVPSIFCNIYGTLGADPCKVSTGQVSNKFTEQVDTYVFGKWTMLKPGFVDSLFKCVSQMALFAFIFYLLTGSITQFLAVLTGVVDLGEFSAGSINIVSSIGSLGIGISNMIKWMTKKKE